MYQHVDTETRPLTPSLVKSLKEMNTHIGERSLDKKKLRQLKDKLDRGLFYAPRFGIITMPDGREIRCNGQHSSTMLSEVNGAFPKCKKAVVDYWRCDTEEDVAIVFSQYDNRISARTKKEVVNAHAKLHDELADNSQTLNAVVCDAIYFAKTEGKYKREAAYDEDRARLLHSDENIEFAQWAGAVFAKNWLSRTPIVAAAYKTWFANKERAKDFWQQVSDGSGQPETASRIYHDHLKHKWGNGTVVREGTRSVYVKAHHAWNAYMTGTATRLSYFRKAGIPKLKTTHIEEAE